MAQARQNLIEQMTAELKPVRALRLRDGLVLVTLCVLVTVLAVEFLDGLWRGILRGEASPFFLIVNGSLLVLGLASAISVLTMATPRVGNRHDGPKWAMAMVAILPVAAMAVLATPHNHAAEAVLAPYGLICFFAALASSTITGLALLVWLRRGAPVSPNLAGLHLGVAAGAFGALSYGMACSIDGIVHLGLAHVLPVAVTGLVGRFAIPPLLRW